MNNYHLLLETATTNCSVAIANNGELLFCKESNAANFRHSDYLHVFIEASMQEVGLSFSALSAVGVSMGPGSYTGLRIGVSSAKGICYANDIPLIGVNTLEVLAQGYSPGECEIMLPMIDARRMEVFTMALNAQYEIIQPTSAMIISEETSAALPKGKKVLFGSGAAKCKSFLKEEDYLFVDEIEVPSAKNMVDLVAKKYAAKQFEDVAYFEPFYLKDFHTNAPKLK